MDKLKDQYGCTHKGKIVPASQGANPRADLSIEVYYDLKLKHSEKLLGKVDLLNVEMAEKKFQAEVRSRKNALPKSLRGHVEVPSLEAIVKGALAYRNDAMQQCTEGGSASDACEEGEEEEQEDPDPCEDGITELNGDELAGTSHPAARADTADDENSEEDFCSTSIVSCVVGPGLRAKLEQCESASTASGGNTPQVLKRSPAPVKKDLFTPVRAKSKKVGTKVEPGSEASSSQKEASGAFGQAANDIATMKDFAVRCDIGKILLKSNQGDHVYALRRWSPATATGQVKKDALLKRCQAAENVTLAVVRKLSTKERIDQLTAAGGKAIDYPKDYATVLIELTVAEESDGDKVVQSTLGWHVGFMSAGDRFDPVNPHCCDLPADIRLSTSEQLVCCNLLVPYTTTKQCNESWLIDVCTALIRASQKDALPHESGDELLGTAKRICIGAAALILVSSADPEILGRFDFEVTNFDTTDVVKCLNGDESVPEPWGL